MKNISEIVIAIASSKPTLTIDNVQTNGDVAFHVLLKDCALAKEDCSNAVLRTRFFVNFIGEFLVRENIQRFAEILIGLDSALYQKMICVCEHTDFGMLIDYKLTTITFQMHMSLVQHILTEDFTRLAGEQSSGFTSSGRKGNGKNNKDSKDNDLNKEEE